MGLLIDDIVRLACDEFDKIKGSVACKKGKQNCCIPLAKECMKAVHEERTKKQEYDCVIMPDYYITAFQYEYASEMEYALNIAYPDGLPTPLNVVSIGSGASPDLYAMYNMLKQSQDAEAISYIGIEPNQFWDKYIHFIQAHHPNYYHASESVLNLSAGTKDRIKNCDLLTIQYFFSAVNCDTNGLNPYFDVLINEIIQYMQPGSKIIINDVNSRNMGRDLWIQFFDKIKLYHKSAEKTRRYFFKKGDFTPEYGDMYPHPGEAEETDILYEHPKMRWPFDPHLSCRSCQMIITL